MMKKLVAMVTLVCLLIGCLSVCASSCLISKVVTDTLSGADVDIKSIVLSMMIGADGAEDTAAAIFCLMLVEALSKDAISSDFSDISKVTTIECGSDLDELQFRINKDYVLSYDGTYIEVSRDDSAFSSCSDISYSTFVYSMVQIYEAFQS